MWFQIYDATVVSNNDANCIILTYLTRRQARIGYDKPLDFLRDVDAIVRYVVLFMLEPN
jgi:hypothetical protein